MKFIQRDLLTLLISLFILSACSNPESVGLDVDPEYAITGSLIDSSTIRTTTVREDTVATTGLSKYPLGYLKDPALGTTESNIALSLTVPTEGFGFGNAPALDSAVLVLDYNDFYGDSLNSVYQINVHQLQEAVPSGTLYNTRQYAFNPAVLGSKNVRVSFRDSVKVRAIVKGKADVDSTYAPQVRIPIDPTFVRNNFLAVDSTNFASSATLQKLLKGFYLTVNKTNSTGVGGVMFFDLTTVGASKLEVYYKNTNGAAIDTNVARFGIQSGALPVAASFRHTYSTEVQAQLANPQQSFSTTYVQGLAGLRTKVTFPNLKNLSSLGKVTVNKAELVIEVQDPTGPLAPLPRLFLYRTDIAGQKQYFPDVSDRDFRSVTDLQFGGYYSSTNKRYVFSITAYVQDIINGKLKQYDAFLAPAEVTADKSAAISPTATVAGRSILGGFGNPTYKMKLNIFYTSANN